MSYRYSPKSRFRSKRPVRSFRDLGIYQTTEKISVEIMRNIIPHIPEESSLKKDLADCCMKIPHFIAEAHSRRFDDKEKAMKLLEEVLFLCNKVVVYLEQVRDIYSEDVKRETEEGKQEQKSTANPQPVSCNEQAVVERVVIDEIIKKYFYVRPKIFNFYKVWKRFANEDSKNKQKGAEDEK